MTAVGRPDENFFHLYRPLADSRPTPLNALLYIRNGYEDTRWNFVDAIGTPLATPGRIGNAVNGLTCSFPTTKPKYATESGFAAFSDTQKQAARQVLTSIAETIGISFTEVAGVGAITFALTTDAAFAYTYTPWWLNRQSSDGTIVEAKVSDTSGDAWFNKGFLYVGEESFHPGGSGYDALIHELGHALGLKHPFEGDLANGYDGQDTPGTQQLGETQPIQRV